MTRKEHPVLQKNKKGPRTQRHRSRPMRCLASYFLKKEENPAPALCSEEGKREQAEARTKEREEEAKGGDTKGDL